MSKNGARKWCDVEDSLAACMREKKKTVLHDERRGTEKKASKKRNGKEAKTFRLGNTPRNLS
jgi:hypothetical protein